MYLTQMQSLEEDEIIEVINKASLFGGVICQIGSLQVSTCSIRKINVVDGQIIMEILGVHKLDSSNVLCINFAYRNLTFRVQPRQFTVSSDKITCDIPLEAKAIELRPGGERHVLPFDSYSTASIHRIEKRDTLAASQIKIVDVSKHGLGAYLLWSAAGDLVQYDHVWIRELNDQKLETPVFCRVEYVNARKFKDDTTILRVGLSTDKALPEEVYEELIKKCRLVLSA
ncbi:MAG TPA: hypothetical protein VNJ08_04440 [Bacteriovoracaceae bacterium]|nr:hypothetical protein [Bacteriovoracaceae bacterium]